MRLPFAFAIMSSLVAGTVSADGERSSTDIDRVVKAGAGVFRACYQKEIKRDPTLSGKVVVAFTIAAAGTVASSKITSSTLASKPVESCLLANINRLRFPAASAPADVSYPFVFMRG